MAGSRSSPVPGGRGSSGPRETKPVGLGFEVFAAAVMQVVVLVVTFFMGLGMEAVAWVAALLQAVAGFVVLVRVGARRPGLALLVPVASFALTQVLAVGGARLAEARACSDEEVAAAQSFAPPPGVEVRFTGYAEAGCAAYLNSDVAPDALVAHYRAELRRLGWTETPQWQQGPVGVAGTRDGVHLDLAVWSSVEEYDAVVTVFETPDHWK